jgi:hypothetical protein
MPRRLIPENIWEEEFYVPLPGEPRRIGPLVVLFQRLLNRTEKLKSRIAAILGLPWDATPPDTLAGLAGRVSTLESNQGSTTLSAHRFASVLDHPDGSVTAAKLAPIRNAPTITPSLGDWLLGGLASGTGVGKIPIGQANGVPLLNSTGAFASADAYLDRGGIFGAVDWNTIKTAGVYTVYSEAFGSGSANFPPTTYQSGVLIVLVSTNGGAVQQIYIPYSVGGEMHFRQSRDGGTTWTPWLTAGNSFGHNANGSYIRFADGTQICWSSHADSTFGTLVTGLDTNYKYRTKTWVYPAAFAVNPVVVVSGDLEGARLDVFNVVSVGTSVCSLEVGQYNTTNVTVAQCFSLAIGRWR